MNSAIPKPLVSIIALSYKENIWHLKACLESIFSQTYENIELIISNDGADTFSEPLVKEIIEKNKKDNIQKIILSKNEYNLGTVKNCNIALGLSSGNYIMFVACDDVYSNNDVIANMVNGFNYVPKDVLAIVGQTAKYNSDLSEVKELYVNARTQELINTLSPDELYRTHLVLDSLIPATSVLYKREAFEKYGNFDERFFLIEDYSYTLSATKKGLRYYYLDIICINHRDSGISHSAYSVNNPTSKLFLQDLILILEEVLLDNSLDKEILEKVKLNLDNHKRLLQDRFETPLIKPAMSKIIKYSNHYITKKSVFTLYLLSLLIISVGLNFINVELFGTSTILSYTFITLGLFCFFVSTFMLLLKIIIELYMKCADRKK